MKKICAVMAQGFEEMELVITVDVLRRAGLEVITASVETGATKVIGSRGIPMVPDTDIDKVDFKSIDLLFLPGGLEGTKRLAENERVLSIVREFHKCGKIIAAICAAPTVLLKAGIAAGKRMTSHPIAEEHMKGVSYETDRIVVDGNIVTSRAAGTTFDLAFKLVEILIGHEKVKEVNKNVLAII